MDTAVVWELTVSKLKRREEKYYLGFVSYIQRTLYGISVIQGWQWSSWSEHTTSSTHAGSFMNLSNKTNMTSNYFFFQTGAVLCSELVGSAEQFSTLTLLCYVFCWCLFILRRLTGDVFYCYLLCIYLFHVSKQGFCNSARIELFSG